MQETMPLMINSTKTSAKTNQFFFFWEGAGGVKCSLCTMVPVEG